MSSRTVSLVDISESAAYAKETNSGMSVELLPAVSTEDSIDILPISRIRYRDSRNWLVQVVSWGVI